MAVRRIYFFLILLVLVSCRKILDKTSVSGIVINQSTSSTVSEAVVSIYKEDPDCFSCPAIEIESVTTGKDGYYEFDVKPSGNFLFSVNAKHALFFSPSSGAKYIDKAKNNKHVDISLRPAGWLKLHVQNTSPYNDDDFIWISGGGNGSGIRLYGTDIDTLIDPFSVDTTIPQNVVYEVTKNGVKTRYSSSVSVNAFDTLTFSINY